MSTRRSKQNLLTLMKPTGAISPSSSFSLVIGSPRPDSEATWQGTDTTSPDEALSTYNGQLCHSRLKCLTHSESEALVKKQRLLDGANWKDVPADKARELGITKAPNRNSYLSGPKTFRISELAKKAGVPAHRASAVVSGLRATGQIPPAERRQGPVGLGLKEARIVLAALYLLAGKEDPA